MAAINRAAGLNRGYSAQKWPWLGKKLWLEARDEAIAMEFKGDYRIWGGDIDPKCVEISRANAKRAGVENYIEFEKAEAAEFCRPETGGIIITNPPYGERVMERSEAEAIYAKFGRAVKKLDGWKMYILSSHTEFERTFGRKAVKKRKLYNGMIKCDCTCTIDFVVCFKRK